MTALPLGRRRSVRYREANAWQFRFFYVLLRL